MSISVMRKSKPKKPAADRDTWTTPTWIAEALGSFDLDPCSNDRAVIRSTVRYSLDDGDDGLKLASAVPSHWRVFINPPYSRAQVAKWVAAYAHTRFCFLLRFDPSTKWFATLYRSSGLVVVPRRRINFDPPPGVKSFPNIYPHALFFAHEEDASEQIKRLSYAWRTKANGARQATADQGHGANGDSRRGESGGGVSRGSRRTGGVVEA